MDLKKLKFIGVGIAVLLLGIVIFQNFEEKTIRILFAEISMPVSLLLLLTFCVGMVSGWLLTYMLLSKKTARDKAVK